MDSSSSPARVQCRVELTRNDVNLYVKPQDLTVARLAAVFKVKSHTVYLEEMFTKNAEFPDNGVFKVKDDVLFAHYNVCGEDEATQPAVSTPQPGPSNFPNDGSSFRPWSTRKSAKVNPLSLSKKSPLTTPHVVAGLKRTFPYVSLCLDHTGKNVTVESTIDSIYVKLPENGVCVDAVLEEVSTRVGIATEDLVLLDSKFVPVSNNERDLDYWKPHSRRFYVADRSDFTELTNKKGKSTKHSRKHKYTLFDFTSERKEQRCTCEQMMKSIEKITLEVASIRQEIADIKEKELVYLEEEKVKVKADAVQKLLQFLHCKLCKKAPTPPVLLVTCCKQLFGCEACFQKYAEKQKFCPFCYQDIDGSTPLTIRGLDESCSLITQS